MATPAQTSPLERQRMTNLRSSRSAVGMAAASLLSMSGPAPTQGYQDPYAGARTTSMTRSPLAEMPQAVRDTRTSRGSKPVFGEEGFGDVEAARAQRTETEAPGAEEEAEQEAPSEEPEETYQMQAEQRVRQARAEEEQVQEEQGEPSEGLGQIEELARDQIDTVVNAVCYAIPVLGHWAWWNVRMAYGSWIAKGNSKFIGPFGWSDVILVVLPIKTESKVAGKAVVQILPDFIAQLTLVFIDLLLVTSGTTLLVFQAMILYVLYESITNPIGSLTQFGGLISSFL